MVAGDNTEPLIPEPQPGCCARCQRRCAPCTGAVRRVHGAERESGKTKCHECALWVAIFMFFWILIGGIIQFFMMHYALLGCNASHLDNYDYPGGGWNCPADTPASHRAMPLCVRGPAENAVPGTALLLERAPTTWGQKFEVYHATEGNAQIDRAPVGAWWRTWGPWYWTYTYEDQGHSQTTLYMRPSIIGMVGLYSSHRIMRCDGTGDPWFFTEGSNWMGNRIRTFFGMQRESSFKIFQGADRVATALETFHGTKSITFKRYPGDNQIGSSVLVENSGHSHDLWSQHLSDTANIQDIIPYYVMNAATCLFAYRWRSIRQAQGVRGGDRGSSQPQFLMEMPDASAGFHEETDDTVEEVKDTANLGVESGVLADEVAIEKVDA